jgi:hypothetical protein
MREPSIRFLVSSPYGDIPADKNKWHLPLDGDALKTPYKRYFYSIRDFFLRDELKPLLEAANKKLGWEIQRKEVNEIIVRSEKHGFLYHPSSIEVILKDDRVKFGLNVAISEIGKYWLREEFSVLKRLNTKFNLHYLPEPYVWGELNSILFLLEDWFEGYHEFHISKDGEGIQRLKLWDFSNSGSGYTYLSSEQSFEIYKQASKILTLYYDFKDCSQILHWHHAAGDFVVRIEEEKNSHSPPLNSPLSKRGYRGVKGSMGGGLLENRIDVRLTTARQYKSLMALTDRDPVDPFLGLFCFFLNMTIRMRLDKLDGLGEMVWADDICLEATVKGFLEALKLKEGLKHYIGSAEDFLRLLKSFGKEELKIVLNPLIDLYTKEEDFPVLIENLENHIRKLYAILQSHPL